MTAHRGEDLTLPIRPALDAQEYTPDLLPRPDGIRFVRGLLLGIILCVPIWILIWRVFFTHP